ncbi:MAG TPA: hypothetical protein VFQ39_12425 [Longimicrobium sp.]|nr:hypothetical protein [Longimicrobium sp.]
MQRSLLIALALAAALSACTGGAPTEPARVPSTLPAFDDGTTNPPPDNPPPPPPTDTTGRGGGVIGSGT